MSGGRRRSEFALLGVLSEEKGSVFDDRAEQKPAINCARCLRGRRSPAARDAALCPARCHCPSRAGTALLRAGTALPGLALPSCPSGDILACRVPCWGLGCCPFVSHVPSPEHLCRSSGASAGAATAGGWGRDRDRDTETVQGRSTPCPRRRPLPCAGLGALGPGCPKGCFNFNICAE